MTMRGLSAVDVLADPERLRMDVTVHRAAAKWIDWEMQQARDPMLYLLRRIALKG